MRPVTLRPFLPLLLVALLPGSLHSASTAGSARAADTASGDAATAAPAPALARKWRAVRMNRRPLPAKDVVDAGKGVKHAVMLDEMILSLNPRGGFDAMVRYRRTLTSFGEKVENTPLLHDLVRGTYTVSGSTITFVSRTGNGKKVRPLVGTIAGDRITVPFDYANGVATRHYVLELQVARDIW